MGTKTITKGERLARHGRILLTMAANGDIAPKAEEHMCDALFHVSYVMGLDSKRRQPETVRECMNAARASLNRLEKVLLGTEGR